jgi:hypothetical protein
VPRSRGTAQPRRRSGDDSGPGVDRGRRRGPAHVGQPVRQRLPALSPHRATSAPSREPGIDHPGLPCPGISRGRRRRRVSLVGGRPPFGSLPSPPFHQLSRGRLRHSPTARSPSSSSRPPPEPLVHAASSSSSPFGTAGSRGGFRIPARQNHGPGALRTGFTDEHGARQKPPPPRPTHRVHSSKRKTPAFARASPSLTPLPVLPALPRGRLRHSPRSRFPFSPALPVPPSTSGTAGSRLGGSGYPPGRNHHPGALRTGFTDQNEYRRPKRIDRGAWRAFRLP